jgi:site-specific recombinase XerD
MNDWILPPTEKNHRHSAKPWSEIMGLSQTMYIQNLREILIRLLGSTAIRISEASEIRTYDIELAFEQGFLSLRTKIDARELNTLRVCLSKELIEHVNNFLKTQRKQVIDHLIETGKLKTDHEFLFISETTGKPFSPAALSNLSKGKQHV